MARSFLASFAFLSSCANVVKLAAIMTPVRVNAKIFVFIFLLWIFFHWKDTKILVYTPESITQPLRFVISITDRWPGVRVTKEFYGYSSPSQKGMEHFSGCWQTAVQDFLCPPGSR